MKAEKLLNKYPLTAKIVKDWFLNKMLESMNTDEIPEEFKQAVLDEGISDDRLGIIIDAQPRSLFDVFDENKVFIFIHYMDVKDNVEFFHSFRNIDTNPVKLFKTRKEAEATAIESAFEILESKLTPKEKIDENK